MRDIKLDINMFIVKYMINDTKFFVYVTWKSSLINIS